VLPYVLSQLLFYIYADFAQHTVMEKGATAVAGVTKFSDFNSIHLCLQDSPKCQAHVVKFG
jgi:hypothetical protein